MIEKLAKKYQQWRDRRFLRRHHCSSWRQYHRVYDPGYYASASRVCDRYPGYPHVYCFDNHSHFVYNLLADYGPGGVRYGFDHVQTWCDKNLQHGYRMDCLRVIKNYWDEWEVNELGGSDFVFVAFENEQDYMHFVLRWA